MKFFILLFSLFGLLIANDISYLIKKLNNTPKAQRYIIMNQIKRELVKLNSAQRSQAILQLKKSLSKKNLSNKNHFKHQYGKNGIKCDIKNNIQHMHGKNSIKKNSHYENIKNSMPNKHPTLPNKEGGKNNEGNKNNHNKNNHKPKK